MDMNDRGLVVVLGTVVVVLLLGSGLVGGMMGFGYMGPGMMGWGYTGQPGMMTGWAWAFGALMMLVFWAAVIGGIILFVRWAAGQGTLTSAMRQPEDAMTILRRRYAAGEIDQATYDQMKDKLSDGESKSSQPVGTDGVVGAPH